MPSSEQSVPLVMASGVISAAEFQERLDKLRQAMNLRQLDALFAYANKTHPGHVHYLTGYETRFGIHDTAVCFVTESDCVLMINASFD